MLRVARWVLVWLVAAPPALAQPTSPYPDLWERALAVPPGWTFEDARDPKSGPVIGRRADGEVVIRLRRGDTVWMTEFFSGRTRTSALAEASGSDLAVQKEPRFSDRWFLSSVPSYDFQGCYATFGARLTLSLAGAYRRHHLIVRLDRPRKPPIRSSCKAQAGLSFDETVFAPNLWVHVLDDESFIAVAPEIGKAVRIRRDLSSPAIDSRKLFLVHAWHIDPEGDPRATHDAVLAKLPTLPPAHAEPRLGPPYAEVWQRPLPSLGPFHSLETTSGILPNGDVAILMKNGDRYAVVEFFSGRVTHGRSAYDRAKRGIEDETWDQTQFADGTYVIATGTNLVDRCYAPFFADNFIGKTDAEGRIAHSITWWLVAYPERPRDPPLRRDCKKNTMNYREWVFAAPLTTVLALPDDTLIAAAPQIGRVIRINRELHSPALDGRHLFILTDADLGHVSSDEAKLIHDRVKAYVDARRQR